MSAQEDFEQIRLQFVDPLQHDYEVIRPMVLFGETAAERSRQTGMERTTVGDKARRFVLDGMEGLRDRRTEASGPQEPGYPEAIAGYIIYLKQLYPPIHLREIERILLRKFGFKTNHHTLRRFLEPYDTPVQLELNLITFVLEPIREGVITTMSARQKLRTPGPNADLPKFAVVVGVLRCVGQNVIRVQIIIDLPKTWAGIIRAADEKAARFIGQLAQHSFGIMAHEFFILLRIPHHRAELIVATGSLVRPRLAQGSHLLSRFDINALGTQAGGIDGIDGDISAIGIADHNPKICGHGGRYQHAF